jgi:pyruvate/2-oxoacid:ferredoxin oxidoreductase alpha subunit
MSRVCKTAIDMLKTDGIEVGLIRPQTLFPFPDSDRADHTLFMEPLRRTYAK